MYARIDPDRKEKVRYKLPDGYKLFSLNLISLHDAHPKLYWKAAHIKDMKKYKKTLKGISQLQKETEEDEIARDIMYNALSWWQKMKYRWSHKGDTSVVLDFNSWLPEVRTRKVTKEELENAGLIVYGN